MEILRRWFETLSERPSTQRCCYSTEHHSYFYPLLKFPEAHPCHYLKKI